MIGGAFYLKNINLYVVRRNTLGEMKDSAPCIACSNMIKKFNIKNLVYSNSEGTLVKCKARDYRTNHVSLGNRAIKMKNLCPPC